MDITLFAKLLLSGMVTAGMALIAIVATPTRAPDWLCGTEALALIVGLVAVVVGMFGVIWTF